jgi:ubiquinone/menaquinone biosynthesis C-methylase UbiE
MVTSADARRLEKPRALLPHCISAGTGVWADIGSGDGVFTTVIQDILGPDGRVIAVDRDGRALKHLEKRFLRDHPGIPVETIQADLRTPFDLPALDGFVAGNVLHFFETKARSALFNRLVRFLKPGGLAVVVGYNTRKPNVAVPFPLAPDGFLMLAAEVGLDGGRIAARVPSSFLGEMYAGVATRTSANESA